VEIRIKDNGKGISEKIKDKIWFPFFTSKEKGTGMGLALVRKIITSLNGDIQLVDSNQSGTIFKIVIYKSAVTSV
jgi:nitrogen-specific signal transduction histidine kinase